MEIDPNSNNRHFVYYLVVFVILCYIISVTMLSVFLLFSGWLSNFNFIFNITNSKPADGLDDMVILCLYTISGALLGGSTLSITSFHRHIIVNKCLGVDHVWGYILAPLLSTVIGILVFCLIQGGLIVFTGGDYNNSSAISAMLGYIAFGAIGAYNWDVFILKLQSLSKKINDEMR